MAVEARLCLQGMKLSSSLLIGSFMFGYAALKSYSVSADFLGLMLIVLVSNFVFGPFIVIRMSSPIRKHIKKLFKLDNNVVQVLPFANNRANERVLENKL